MNQEDGVTDRDRAARIVAALRTELAKHLPVDRLIESFGQVAAARRREAGEIFSLRDHLRGMVLAMLSANRPWRPIADNLDHLDEVFGGYRPSFLEQADPQSLTKRVLMLRCGNRRLQFQMRAIRPNLETMKRIEAQHGTLDVLVTAREPDRVALELGTAGSRWKLRELGPPLVLEYLKNVGIRAVKPDVHVRRICGPDRLGIISTGESDVGASRRVAEFANAGGVHAVEFDNMIWLLGADDYAQVCTATPSCAACELRSLCAFPGRNRSP